MYGFDSRLFSSASSLGGCIERQLAVSILGSVLIAKLYAQI